MSNCTIKHLKEVSREEQVEFFNSFDIILSDVDGVIWQTGHTIIEGTPEGINSLKIVGKKVYFVTNNTTIPIEAVLKRLEPFEITEDSIVRPDLALIYYLKKIKFDKDIYVVSAAALKNTLKKAGFQVHDDSVNAIEETIDGVTNAIHPDKTNVGAVIIDVDLNVTFTKLQKCIEYIKTNNALFLTGTWDPVLPFKHTQLIGPKYFIQAVEELSGQKPTIISKPHEKFHEAIKDKLGDLDPSRVLFIGDSVQTDMAYAATYGYKKLMTLTGVTTMSEINDWKYDESLKPDYYVDSVANLHEIINNLKSNCLL